MRHYGVEEKFVKVCEGWSGDEVCDERSKVRMVWY